MTKYGLTGTLSWFPHRTSNLQTGILILSLYFFFFVFLISLQYLSTYWYFVMVSLKNLCKLAKTARVILNPHVASSIPKSLVNICNNL